MKTLLKIALASLVTFAGCSTTQMAAYNATKAKVAATLSTPQAKALEAAGEMIAEAAISAVPGGAAFAWTIPLAVNSASTYLNATTTAQTVAAVQQAVTAVSGVPAYHNVAIQVGNAISVAAPATPDQRVVAAQALAMYISQALAAKTK